MIGYVMPLLSPTVNLDVNIYYAELARDGR
jgi:hypothetical protein